MSTKTKKALRGAIGGTFALTLKRKDTTGIDLNCLGNALAADKSGICRVAGANKAGVGLSKMCGDKTALPSNGLGCRKSV